MCLLQVEGLRLLNRADPFVEISVLDSGEHVLGAAGKGGNVAVVVAVGDCVKSLSGREACAVHVLGSAGKGGNSAGAGAVGDYVKGLC